MVNVLEGSVSPLYTYTGTNKVSLGPYFGAAGCWAKEEKPVVKKSTRIIDAGKKYFFREMVIIIAG